MIEAFIDSIKLLNTLDFMVEFEGILNFSLLPTYVHYDHFDSTVYLKY